MLATDMLIGHGAELAPLSAETLAALNTLLPAHWSHNNPIDILGDAGPARYASVVDIVAKDPANDGLLVILTPQAMTDPTGTALELKKFAKLPGKPILASWMGAQEVDGGEAILNEASIPTFKYPDRAARAFSDMWRYSYNLRALYETPAPAENSVDVTERRERTDHIVKRALASGRTLLTELESKSILEAYGIPTVKTLVARSADGAVKLADQIGYPVVLKLHSETITHKTDVGGVQLNLRNATAVRRAFRAIEAAVAKLPNHQPAASEPGESRSRTRGNGDEDGLAAPKSDESGSRMHPESFRGTHHALRSTLHAPRSTSPSPPAFLGVTVQPMIHLDGYELILGSSLDPQFGPVLLFGAGGQLVEVFKDRALGLPPLNATLARRLIERTRIYEALKGVRGRQPIDLPALEQLLVRFSQLVVEQPWIAEIDVNPLLASPEALIALDARVVLQPKDVRVEDLPHLAIRPYPSQYVTNWKLRDGTPVTLRPIRPEDEVAMVGFHKTLSEQSVYNRYFSALKLPQRIAHERLTRICFNDYDRELALVVDYWDPKTNEHEILGVGRLSKVHAANDAEFALLVSDKWQGFGIGTELLKLLVQIGRNEKLERIIGYILPENYRMQQLCKKVGFELHREPDAGELKAHIEL